MRITNSSEFRSFRASSANLFDPAKAILKHKALRSVLPADKHKE